MSCKENKMSNTQTYKLKSLKVNLIEAKEGQEFKFTDGAANGNAKFNSDGYIIHIQGTSATFFVKGSELEKFVSEPKPKKPKVPGAKDFIKTKGLEDEYEAWKAEQEFLEGEE